MTDKLMDKPLYLRLTRQGDEFKAAKSNDGKEWSLNSTHEVSGFGRVLIGPVAAHNTNAKYDVVFDEFVMKKPPEEKK